MLSEKFSKLLRTCLILPFNHGYNDYVTYKDRTFSSFICSRYRTEIDSAIGDFAYANSDSFSLKEIESVSCVDCEGFEYKKIWIRDLPKLKLEFDMAVAADLAFQGHTGLREAQENKTEWFLVSGEVDFSDLDDGFVITEIQIYDGKYNPRVDYSYTLSPCISEKDTEEAAREFLSLYYSEMFISPRPLDVDTVVSRMGLHVEKRHLSPDDHIFGQIFFRTSSAETYPDNDSAAVLETFSEGTILVDDKVFFLRNYGSERHTIIHECIHWHLHRKKFLLLESIKMAESGIRCCVTGEMQNYEKSNDAWFLEWQANKIASKVLVPESILKQRVSDYLAAEKAEHPSVAEVYLIKNVVVKIAGFFGVSKQVAKIRMEECGYTIVKGAYDYCNGGYPKPYMFSTGSLGEDETFTIGCEDLIIQSMQNPVLSQLMGNGQLIYADSHLVVNNPRYVEKKKSRTELTEYARMHLDECGIKFTVDTSTGHNGVTYHRECVLCRGFNGPLQAEYKFKKIDNENNIAKAEAVIQHEKQISYLMGCIVRTSFTQTLINLMKAQNMSVEELAGNAELASKTVTRCRTGETKDPTLETMVALAIGLDIPFEVSIQFLAVAGYSLLPSNEEHMLYRFFLSDACEMTVKECNALLKARNSKKKLC